MVILPLSNTLEAAILGGKPPDPELDAFLIADAMRPVQAQAGFTVLGEITANPRHTHAHARAGSQKTGHHVREKSGGRLRGEEIARQAQPPTPPTYPQAPEPAPCTGIIRRTSVRRGDCGAVPQLRDTRPPARETGTMYGDNQALERAARRLRRASETARNFAFSLAADEKRQPCA